MEPQLIDYYNQEPYMVKVIDNMNKELEDIQNKYSELEEKYNKLKYDNFKICCSSIEDRNDKHTQMLNNIKNNFNQYLDQLNTTTFGRDFLFDYGFCDRKIYDIIYNEFHKLSDNQNWTLEMTNNINIGLRFFRGREMPHWNKIYNSLTINDIKDIMISHVEDFINENIYNIYTFPGDDDY